MGHVHAVVWIDHNEAHIIHFNPDETEQLTVHAKHRSEHLHHKSGQLGDGKAAQDLAYFSQVEKGLAGATAILIVGPASAKDELAAHIRQHSRALEKCIVGVESADHPTDGQILKLARVYFGVEDRLGQAG